jgi:hypothetical protein
MNNLEFTLNKELNIQKFQIQNLETCKFPSLNNNRTEFHKRLEEKKCKIEYDWGQVNESIWNFNSEIKKNLNQYSCQYRSIERYKDDSKYNKGEWIRLLDGMKILNEVFEVKCTHVDTNSIDYENIFVQFIKKNINIKKIINKNCKPMNVMLISYDSVSRSSWLNRLNKTNHFIFDKMKFEILNGYNIVGDGTTAALTPIYTGQTEEELPNVLKNNGKAQYVDEAYPFIWKELHKKGYISMHLEDWPHVGAFNYRMKGFSNQTCHHYYKHYQMRLEAFKNEKKFNKKNDDFCIGAKKRHKVLIDLMTQFKIEYNKIANNLIIMHYVENSHNTNERFNWVDDDLYSFLNNGYNEGLFDNTAIFLYSDHGARFANKRSSKDRYLEERLPFFAIYLPEEYKINNPNKFNNLKINTNLLTSPFDIYATVRDLTCLQTINKNKNNLERSISLLEEISPKRNCENIGISEHFCTCLQDWHAVDLKNQLIKDAAFFSVAKMNEILAPASNLCHNLVLSEILSAEKLLKNKQTQIKIQFITYPNWGVYETLVFNSQIDNFEFKSSNFSIRSRNDISRINSYGEKV